MVKLSFFHIRVTNSNLKIVKLHFEVQTQSRHILEIQFYLCPETLEGYQEKASLFFWSSTKLNYLYIIISYLFQYLFSKLNLLVTRKLGTQN